jgi:hypothetical protein
VAGVVSIGLIAGIGVAEQRNTRNDVTDTPPAASTPAVTDTTDLTLPTVPLTSANP